MKNETFSGIARAGVWGVILGGGIGFAMGMLLAPEEGRKLRLRLGFQLEHLSKKIGTYIDNVSTPVESSDARDRAESLVADVEERAREIRQEIDELLEKYPTSQTTSTN